MKEHPHLELLDVSSWGRVFEEELERGTEGSVWRDSFAVSTLDVVSVVGRDVLVVARGKIPGNPNLLVVVVFFFVIFVAASVDESTDVSTVVRLDNSGVDVALAETMIVRRSRRRKGKGVAITEHTGDCSVPPRR